MVDFPAAVFELDGVEYVKHFMEHDVLDDERRGIGTVEEAAEDDGLVGGVPVAEVGSGGGAAPGEGDRGDGAVEVAGVDVVEELLEVVVVAGGAAGVFAAIGLAEAFEVGADGRGVEPGAVAGLELRGGAAAKDFGDEDFGEGFEDAIRSAAEGFGEADVHFAVAEAEGGDGVGVGAPAEADGVDFGGRAADFEPHLAVNTPESLLGSLAIAVLEFK
jgi:hypothetical protein